MFESNLVSSALSPSSPSKIYPYTTNTPSGVSKDFDLTKNYLIGNQCKA